MVDGYTYSQVLEASVDYFQGDEFAAKVFVDKYALQNLKTNKYLELNPIAMHHRLAKEFARIEQKYPNPLSEDFIFSLLDRFQYIVPQGSPMSAIGNPYQLQSLSNCFVVQGVHSDKLDSYGGIMLADQELAQIMKRRGGVGLDISGIRPKDTSTNNAAKTTDGIAVFMERFSNTCREVAQNGRRGAEMQTISVNHPEIETFINIKRNLKKVTGANISIKLNDAFMNAVKNNEEYILRWPVEATPEEAKVTKKVKALEIWNQIIDSAWTSAEPGLLFWDNVKANTPSDIYHEFGHNSISTNPCQPAWATLLTQQGIKKFDQISVGDVIWSGKQWTKIINKVCTGEKDVYAFKTRAGTFYGTENHRVVSNGEKIEVKDAESIDTSNQLAVPTNINIDDLMSFSNKEEVIKFNHNIIDGLIIGDGMVHKASNNKVVLLIGKDDSDYFTSEIKDLIIENCAGIKESAWQVNTTIQYNELHKTYERYVPDRYKFGDFNTRRAFLRGLYSANGSIVSNRITLKAASFQIIEDVQQMLSSLGIISYYTVNKSHDVEFDNGIYQCKQSYDLNIGTLHGRQLFDKYIGFIHDYKSKKVKQTLNTEKSYKPQKNTYDIVEKEYLGKELVYDITVEADEHTYWTGGLLVSNCGEIVLPAYDACRLLVLNLTGYVKDPFTKKASFDFKKFHEHTLVAQRLMDDIIDLELECIDRIMNKIDSDPESLETKQIEINLWKKIRDMNVSGRRTGLGITALGDAIAMLGFKYGSQDSINITQKIYRALAVGSHTSSCIMAKERGSFPIFNYKLEKDHKYLNSIMQDCDAEILNMWKKTGRRNIANTTTAPTGSVSALTQTTSGIEPVYMLSYTRRKKHNPSDKNARVDFVDAMGDSWQEFTVYHHGVKKWMEVTGESDLTKSPYFGATSNEIDWVASVELQAVAQKSIDHSISKTCNLPETISKDIVSQVYMKAWESGCKGFTVYRDKCRDGVLISNDDKAVKKIDENNRPVNIEYYMAPKRPVELICDIKKVKVQGEAWTMFVGLLNGKPYEVFGGLSKYVDIPNKYKIGKIVKNGKVNGITTYNLAVDENDDQMLIKDIANVFENGNFGAFTRTISLALRHGAPVQYVVEQLSKDKHSDLTSFSKVMARVLKLYIVDGTKSSAEKTCPSCSAENSLIYQEGCLSCKNCQYSKCG